MTNANTIWSSAIFLSLICGTLNASVVQEPTTASKQKLAQKTIQKKAALEDQEKPVRPVFNAAELIRVANALNQKVDFHFRERPIGEVLKSVARAKKIKIEHQLTEAQYNAGITLKKSGAVLGQLLDDALDLANCDYSIRPDGVLIIKARVIAPKEKQKRGDKESTENSADE